VLSCVQLLFSTLNLTDATTSLAVPVPAILKAPANRDIGYDGGALFTGKQIIGAVLRAVAGPSRPGLFMNGKTQIPDKIHGEWNVVFRDSELVMGVLDKSMFGATSFSLVHACHQIYGPQTAGTTLHCPPVPAHSPPHSACSRHHRYTCTTVHTHPHTSRPSQFLGPATGLDVDMPSPYGASEVGWLSSVSRGKKAIWFIIRVSI
jgi:hypothetical protein